jgi:hypothetical protein
MASGLSWTIVRIPLEIFLTGQSAAAVTDAPRLSICRAVTRCSRFHGKINCGVPARTAAMAVDNPP